MVSGDEPADARLLDARPGYGSTDGPRPSAAEGVLVGAPPQPVSAAARCCIFEFGGTFALTVAVWGCAQARGGALLTAAVLAGSLALSAASGARAVQLNPAASCSMALAGEGGWREAAGRGAAQAAGGLAAGLLLGLLRREPAAAGPALREASLLVELLCTASICLALRSWPSAGPRGGRRDDWPRGLATALTAAAGVCAASDLTGAPLNPALVLGLDAAARRGLTGRGLVLCAAELAGGALAAALRRAALAAEGAWRSAEERPPPRAAPLVVEFLGTLALALVAGVAAGAGACARSTLGTAIALAALTFTLPMPAPCLLLNPAASFASALAGYLAPGVALARAAVQCAAGAVAGIACRWLQQAPLQSDAVRHGVKLVDPKEGAEEFALVGLLVYSALALAPAAAAPGPAEGRARLSLALGACTAIGGLSLGAATGGLLNPALSLARSVAGLGATPDPCAWAQLSLWQLGGGLLAVSALRATRPPAAGAAEEPEDAAAGTYAAEFEGTFVLAFLVACCSLLPGGPAWRGLAVGAAAALALLAAAPRGGGYLNPAASLTLGLVGELEWPAVRGYMAAQLAACALSGLCFSLLLFLRPVALEPVAGFSVQAAAAAEVLGTLLLCAVAGSRAAWESERAHSAALALAAVAGCGAAGGISGGCLNPALALGLDVAGTTQATGWGAAWALAGLVGAAGAAALLIASRSFHASGKRGGCGLARACLLEAAGAGALTLLAGAAAFAAPRAAARCAAGASVAWACLTLTFSGGVDTHVNPLVTLAASAIRVKGITLHEAVGRIAAQFVGSACAAALLAALLVPDTLRAAAAEPLGIGLGSCALELLASATLVTAVLCIERSHEAPADAVGIRAVLAVCLIAGAAAAASSGACLNPACTFSLAAINAPLNGRGPVLAVAQFAGGLIAAVVLTWTPMSVRATGDDSWHLAA